MTNTITIKCLSGAGISDYLNELAQLRIEVFRDFPYLYDGSMEYELRYLQTYVDCPEAVIVLAMLGNEVVGAATGLPLAYEEANFKAPFLAHGYQPDEIFYCAESVLRTDMRGQGIGVAFFREREAFAAALRQFRYYAFCAVQRPLDHPLRPAHYQGLDGFWKNRGYAPVSQLQASYRWKDINQDEETTKQLMFWLKSVPAA